MNTLLDNDYDIDQLCVTLWRDSRDHTTGILAITKKSNVRTETKSIWSIILKGNQKIVT